MEGSLERAASGVARLLTVRAGPTVAAAAVVWHLLVAPAGALDRTVETRSFTIPWFTTTAGALVRDMTIAWESYGRLNFRGENAVLIFADMHRGPHIAGRHAGESDPPTAWDALIDRGGALDTGRLFVLSVGAPCGPGDMTTGPWSIDPESGAVWGDDFPPLVLRDAVAAQKALSDSLGVARIRTVAGIGFGGLLALEWRRRYPHMVERAVAIGAPPRAAADDESCQADILRRHDAGEADWVADDPAAIASALAD